MAEKLVTKNDLLNKLRAYRTTPDDDVILYKQKIKNALLSNPYLLYALNDKELESELFTTTVDAEWARPPLTKSNSAEDVTDSVIFSADVRGVIVPLPKK